MTSNKNPSFWFVKTDYSFLAMFFCVWEIFCDIFAQNAKLTISLVKRWIDLLNSRYGGEQNLDDQSSWIKQRRREEKARLNVDINWKKTRLNKKSKKTCVRRARCLRYVLAHQIDDRFINNRLPTIKNRCFIQFFHVQGKLSFEQADKTGVYDFLRAGLLIESNRSGGTKVDK